MFEGACGPAFPSATSGAASERKFVAECLAAGVSTAFPTYDSFAQHRKLDYGWSPVYASRPFTFHDLKVRFLWRDRISKGRNVLSKCRFPVIVLIRR
jgi:hypothetical protein